jgi:hypothetical protein
VKKSSGCLIAVLVFILALVISNIVHDNNGNGSSEPTKSDAYYFAREFVKKHLKAPSTAKFPSIRDNDVSISKYADTWTIKGYVDAENSFGAAIRNFYECKLEHDKNEKAWYLKDLEFY